MFKKTLTGALMCVVGSVLLTACASGGHMMAQMEPEPDQGLPAAQPVATDVSAIPPALVAVGADVDTITAGMFDNGKMWAFEYPPLDYFASEYGFTPNNMWLERARMSALRLPNCTASFVSPHGLVMTNHHCGRGSATSVQQPGENLLDNGFYASSLAEERQVEGLYVDQMIAIHDVTEEVLMDHSGNQDALRENAERAQQRLLEMYGGEDAGIVVQVIGLWNGARYSGYVFQRYDDVRLVMAPELQIGFFGGDPDNFTYPRYALDVTFFRVYGEDGQPLETEDNYFRWSIDGVSQGDPIFVIGNPGSTTRLQTVAQLEFRRDVQEGAVYHLMASRADVLQEFYDSDPATGEEMNLRNLIFGLRNTEKLYQGRWEGLNDPVVMARRRDTERRFLEAIEADPMLAERYGSLVEEMAEIQARKRELGSHYAAFLGLTSSAFSSAAMRRAIVSYQYMQAQEEDTPQERLDALMERFAGIEDQPMALQESLFEARLRDFVKYFGEDHPLVGSVLAGAEPRNVASGLLHSCSLAEADMAMGAMNDGTLTLDDPMVNVVAALYDEYEEYQNRWQELGREQGRLAQELGRARFEVYGTDIPPDATFSLRIADGVAQGYEYNGTVSSVYTTFYGLYDHYYSYGSDTVWDLPDRWLNPPATFDMSTPLNFVATADIIGGNSGSPVINKDLEVVGVAFDGNIESLPGSYIFMPDRNRTVSVDVRAILEALDEIYDADRIAMELRMGRTFESEAEADMMMQ